MCPRERLITCPTSCRCVIRVRTHFLTHGPLAPCPLLLLNPTAFSASDGGYTLLGLPSTAREGSFEGVLWSDPRTCASQAMVLASKQVPTRYGGTYHDVDEADDVAALVRRAPAGLADVREYSTAKHEFVCTSERCIIKAIHTGLGCNHLSRSNSSRRMRRSS